MMMFNLCVYSFIIAPIETNALQQAVVDINIVALHNLREGNREFWEIIKKLSKTQLKDDIVSSEILSYKSKGIIFIRYILKKLTSNTKAFHSNLQTVVF